MGGWWEKWLCRVGLMCLFFNLFCLFCLLVGLMGGGGGVGGGEVGPEDDAAVNDSFSKGVVNGCVPLVGLLGGERGGGGGGGGG